MRAFSLFQALWRPLAGLVLTLSIAGALWMASVGDVKFCTACSLVGALVAARSVDKWRKAKTPSA